MAHDDWFIVLGRRVWSRWCVCSFGFYGTVLTANVPRCHHAGGSPLKLYRFAAYWHCLN